jgi:hypothetical protein
LLLIVVLALGSLHVLAGTDDLGGRDNLAGELRGLLNLSMTHFTIQVTGTAGTPFSGVYEATHFWGHTTVSVTGTVPATYQVSGAWLFVDIHKQTGGPESLEVDLLDGSTLAKVATTQAPYGQIKTATQ